MNTRESLPELRINFGPGLNYLSLWILLPTLKLAEDFDYETFEKGVTRIDLQAPSRILWRSNRHGWSTSLRLLGLGFTLARIKV